MDNSAVSISGLSNTSSGTHGVQFNISTVGFSTISFRFDVRGSGTTSKFWQVEYTTDRTAGPVVWTSAGLTAGGLLELPGTTNYKNDNAYAIDPAVGGAASNNPNFAVRVVAIFNPSTGSFSRNDSTGTAGTVSGGTMRFDMVKLSGTTAPSGYVADANDCDDSRADVNPAGIELCTNLAIDNDCDGSTAESEATDRTTYYADNDGDGYGATASTTLACSLPAGYASASGDCDDGSSSIRPGAAETCNGIDDDCDGSTDEGLTFLTYYTDADNDGFGSSSATGVSSCSPISGSVTNNGDCNDADGAVNPNATEVCDGIDNNCAGGIDEGVTITFYRDADNDTYGSASVTVTGCTAPAGYVSTSG
ncbi:MAG: putative metal-binding motif-containing protein, partial [Phycisphaerales bacterium]